MADQIIKSFKPTAEFLKAVAAKGEGSAIIATLNVLDKDHDVTFPGAFGEQTVLVLPAHNWSSDKPPLGKAVIREVGDLVFADFKLNMKTQGGKEWAEHLKFDLEHGDPVQEWSYGFRINEAGQGTWPQGDPNGEQARFLKALKVDEVSPVVVGAGEGTGTVSAKSWAQQFAGPLNMTALELAEFMNGLPKDWPDSKRRIVFAASPDEVLEEIKLWRKSDKAAIPSHESQTATDTWDTPEEAGRVKSGQESSYYAELFAWVDPDGDPSKKSSYLFLHHHVDGDGTPGAANIQACQSQVAVLNGARLEGGRSALADQKWAADRERIYRHLARHITDGQVEPPAFEKSSTEGFKMSTHIDFVNASLAEARGLIDRVVSLADQREKDGRKLSAERRGELTKMATTLAGLLSDLGAVLDAADDGQKAEVLKAQFDDLVRKGTDAVAETAKQTARERRNNGIPRPNGENQRV